MSFRPLSRQIGLYLSFYICGYNGDAQKLPSPLEVDRFISENLITNSAFPDKFPSPLEVYRFISG